MPNTPASSSVTTPARPNSSISARPITNGGVMIGSTVNMRSPFLNGSGVRVAARAKARPSSVDPLAVISASVRVRQAVPQLPPFRQLRLQMAGSCILAIRPSGLNDPSASCTEATNMLSTG
ncbi:hypothetical protein D3C80_1072700 [compost metagenome]